MKHLINFSECDGQILNDIVNKAIKIKKDPNKYSTTLKGKKLYMLFQKTSTRTALSFSTGMVELGGNYFTQNWQDSNFTVGSLEDETKYVSKNVDIIMARLKYNDDIELMSQYSTVPVINGCCNKYHPCQALADMVTIKEIFGGFDIKMLYIGVKNNVFNSLLESLPKLGGELFSITPIVNEPSHDDLLYEKALASQKYHDLNTKITKDDLKDLIQGIDIVYTDSWVDMEYFNNPIFAEEKNHRINKMMPFQINEGLMGESKAIIMHDMPVHTGYEIEKSVLDKNFEVILQQAGNRKYAQNAVLTMLTSEGNQ